MEYALSSLRIISTELFPDCGDATVQKWPLPGPDTPCFAPPEKQESNHKFPSLGMNYLTKIVLLKCPIFKTVFLNPKLGLILALNIVS